MAKGLKIDDELETSNLDKGGNESVVADSVEQFNLKEPNHLNDKRMRD